MQRENIRTSGGMIYLPSMRQAIYFLTCGIRRLIIGVTVKVSEKVSCEQPHDTTVWLSRRFILSDDFKYIACCCDADCSKRGGMAQRCVHQTPRVGFVFSPKGKSLIFFAILTCYMNPSPVSKRLGERFLSCPAMSFRDLVLGSNVFIPSRVDYRNAILRSQLAIITFVVAVGYVFIDIYHGVRGNESYYLAVAMLAVVTVVLNRFQKYKLATILFLLSINFFIFYFSIIDPFGSGVFMLFAVSSLMAFALVG